MFPPRRILAVACCRDLTGAAGDRVVERGIVPQRANGVVPRRDFTFGRQGRRLERHPRGNGQHTAAAALAEVAADDVRQRSAIADERRNRVDHGFGGNAPERLFPHRRHDEDTREREVVGRRGHRRRRHDLGIAAEVDAGNRVERSAAVSRLHDKDRNVGPSRSEHVGEPREQPQPFVRRRVDEGHERARLRRRHHRRPLERWLERSAHETHALAVQVGQELAARERVVDVREVPLVVVAEPSHGECRHDAARLRSRHRLQDHRVAVAGNEVRRREFGDELVEQRQIPRRLGTVRPQFVMVPRTQHGDRHLLDAVAHDARGAPRRVNALLPQVFFKRESHPALEAGRREDMARMTGVGEPLDDRAKTLRHTGGSRR